jgi:uncharacterized membrane protein
MRRANIIAVAIVLITLALSIAVYDRLPDKMVTHWGISGEPDGYMDKTVGLFLLPGMLAVFALLFAKIPDIDPLKKNIEKFRSYYENFIILIFLFLLNIQIMMIAWNMGYTMDIGILVSLWIALLFFYIGVMLKHAKKNWFIGIRTPWTMSSEAVWDKTHAQASKLFKATGIVILFGIFSAELTIILILGSVLVVGVYTTWFSYSEYKKEQKPKKKVEQ